MAPLHWAATTAALLLSHASAQSSTILPFSYTLPGGGAGAGCFPNSAPNGRPNYAQPALTIGSQAYVCININGKVTSMFNIKVDQYTAVTLAGSACTPLRGHPRYRGAVFFFISPATPPTSAPPPHTRALPAQATTRPPKTRASSRRTWAG